MNGPQLKSWREYHQLTQDQLGQMLGVFRETVARWETDARAIPPFLGLALETVQRELPKTHKRRIQRVRPRSKA